MNYSGILNSFKSVGSLKSFCTFLYLLFRKIHLISLYENKKIPLCIIPCDGIYEISAAHLIKSE